MSQEYHACSESSIVEGKHTLYSITLLTMYNEHLIQEMINNFVHYGHSKSGGHGGQKINKKQSKAELFFDINSCHLLTDEQKNNLQTIYHHRINKDGILRMSSQEERDFHSNQKKVTKHFYDLVNNILQGNTHHIRGWHDHHHHKHHH